MILIFILILVTASAVSCDQQKVIEDIAFVNVGTFSEKIVRYLDHLENIWNYLS